MYDLVTTLYDNVLRVHKVRSAFDVLKSGHLNAAWRAWQESRGTKALPTISLRNYQHLLYITVFIKANVSTPDVTILIKPLASILEIKM